MHASIAVCMMMVGTWIPPESDITTIPLKDDLSSPSSIQEQEWKERVKKHPLPRVPTIDDRQSSDDYPRNGYNPYAPYRNTQQGGPQQVMPQSPTEAGPMQQPGGGYQAGQTGRYQPGQLGGYQGGGTARNDPYANTIRANPVYGPSGTPLQAPIATVPTSVSSITSNNSVANITRQYGLNNPSPMLSPGASGVGGKPFSDYTPPNGYSPWMGLYQPTANGTLSPYSAYVQPAMSQQNFNAHVSEQIGGVRPMQYGYAPPSGVETPSGGNGLVNQSMFLNYGNYYPMNGSVPNYGYPTY